jgi:hypothetical protein
MTASHHADRIDAAGPATISAVAPGAKRWRGLLTWTYGSADLLALA